MKEGVPSSKIKLISLKGGIYASGVIQKMASKDVFRGVRSRAYYLYFTSGGNRGQI
jgi:hypothetical protein